MNCLDCNKAVTAGESISIASLPGTKNKEITLCKDCATPERMDELLREQASDYTIDI